MQQNLQTQILDFPKVDLRLQKLEDQLSLCGKLAHKKFYCKKDLQHEHLIEERLTKFFCEVRYCDSPDCLIHRFKRTLETFQSIKRFKGLRSLWHFSIGFKAIPEVTFKKDFSKLKKRQEYILNRYFEKLRKQGLNIQAIRVLDFSFKTEGQVYMHYHFAALPVGNKIQCILKLMQKVRKEMINNSRSNTSFIFKNYHLSKKKAVLSYLAIRSSGMYKYDMTKNTNYKHVQSNLRESILNHKYIFLKNVLTKQEYLNSFYNKAHFVCIGGLPRPPRHGSNITDSIPCSCPIHGELTRKDVRIEVSYVDESIFSNPPPNFVAFVKENLDIEVIKIN